ncbi:unnamed protein product [Heterosigma akashiwo]
MKQSFARSVVLGAVKTSIAAKILCTVHAVWPRLAAACADGGHSRPPPPLAGQRGDEAATITGTVNGAFLGLLYGVFRVAPYSFGPFAFLWLSGHDLEFSPLDLLRFT